MIDDELEQQGSREGGGKMEKKENGPGILMTGKCGKIVGGAVGSVMKYSCLTGKIGSSNPTSFWSSPQRVNQSQFLTTD